MIRQVPPGGPYQITVAAAGGSPAEVTVTATLDPLIQPGQRLVLELLPANAPNSSRLFDGGTAPTASNNAAFTFVPPALDNYLVRVRIDGAESPMQLGPGGVPIGPVITL